MNNYDFPMGADCSAAPWNGQREETKEPECPQCGEKDRLEDDTPVERMSKSFICLSCGKYFDEEV